MIKVFVPHATGTRSSFVVAGWGCVLAPPVLWEVMNDEPTH